ncbi:MAG: phosphoglucosamine mutase [Dehalococcoidaceae bacterium]|nr:phosphoglucosamine mutase [Dehalococcoidaceae bacterium]
MQLFGSSGIRLKADKCLLNLALKAGLATGRMCKQVLVGNDTRTSSCSIKSAFAAGLTAAGAQCFDAGLLPTPALAYAGRNFDAAVMVTASHNPPEYNGLKFINSDGSAFTVEQQEAIEDSICNDRVETSTWQEFGEIRQYPQALELHKNRIISSFPGKFRVRVVLDCGGGAASIETPEVLRMMGCDVIELNCSPSGMFFRPSEPLEANLAQLKRTVKETGADLGLAHDGDADRMMAVDELGRFIQGDKLLLLLADSLNAQQVVTTLDASSIVDDRICEVRRTPVGDSYVSRVLKNWGEFGGETSGSWLFPSISLCPDGIFAAAHMVSLAACNRLSEMIDRIPGYPVIRGALKVDRKLMSGIAERLASLNPLNIDYTDGIKLSFTGSWVLIRASGTEPKIRITAEAPDLLTARSLYKRVSEIINEVTGKEKA